MDKTICLACPYHEKRKAHGGWLYVACMKKPYDGAWVKNISCPKQSTAPATIELEDNIPGMIIEPLELPEREIPEDFNI